MLQKFVDSVSRELEAKMFRCLNPQKPHMCDKKSHMQTFPNSWYDRESPTPHELVDAGFYCMGSGNRVSCFYCGGQLFHWKLRDNPSMQSGFLRIRSIETRWKYMEKVYQKHPGLH